MHKASLILKTGVTYTVNQAIIPVGGTIRIGVLASGSGSPLTYIRIERITGSDTLTQLDRGIYYGSEGLDADYTFAKDTAALEIWRIMVMNADRDTAMKTLTVLRGEGYDYGGINYFQSVTLSYQNSSTAGHFLDADKGLVYNTANVAGKENEIDILAYYYVTSGLSSPTLTCPGYTSAIGYYPELAGWSSKNNTLYDYNSSDNDLVNPLDFDAATNDSLLITAYKPDKVSGNCKYCYTGKVIPFKTQAGKYGLLKVISADETETGIIEFAIKIQK
ncbi:MAG: hypothetical protein HGA37_15430 [Lentimicrobium sp.]|nr:hypothetical protein [Lentimicrobium sp.]